MPRRDAIEAGDDDWRQLKVPAVEARRKERIEVFVIRHDLDRGREVVTDKLCLLEPDGVDRRADVRSEIFIRQPLSVDRARLTGDGQALERVDEAVHDAAAADEQRIKVKTFRQIRSRLETSERILLERVQRELEWFNSQADSRHEVKDLAGPEAAGRERSEDVRASPLGKTIDRALGGCHSRQPAVGTDDDRRRVVRDACADEKADVALAAAEGRTGDLFGETFSGRRQL
ncbi:MAG: hypothetical protein ACJ76I_06230 [Gaiellaceae bacterium]